MRRRLIIAVVLLVVGLPPALVALALAAANTEWGRARLAGAVAAATADGPVRVQVGHVGGTLPVSLRLRDVNLSDRAGAFAHFEHIRLDWSPLALLGGTLAVDRVELEGGAVSRAPDLPPDDTAPSPGPAVPSLAFPAPPIALRVSALRIVDLELGEGLAGRAAVLAAELQAAVTARSASATGRLTASGPEGTARLDLDVAVVPADGTLRAELRATEPQGGLVAGLLALPERPALDLTLTGAGTLADWKGRLSGGFGPTARIDLSLGVSAAATATRVNADGTAAVGDLVPERLRPLVGPVAELDIVASLDPGGPVTLERLRIGTPAVIVDGSARTGADGVPVAADVTATVPDLETFSPLVGTALDGPAKVRLELRDQGHGATVAVTGAPVIDAVALDGLRAALTADADRPLAASPPAVVWTLTPRSRRRRRSGPTSSPPSARPSPCRPRGPRRRRARGPTRTASW